MSGRRVPFGKPFFAGQELAYIAAAVASGSIAGGGNFTRKCSAWLEEHLRTERALLTHSCTGALEMAAILLQVEPGDEVIMPSFTFVSTANAFVLRGARPVFVDIRPDTLNIDETLIEAAITPRTRAIVPVHYAGGACAMESIMAIAAHHRLMVVEDAAQGLLSRHQNRSLGSIGHLGCLSFHETKNVICGEGGALLVNDPGLVERAEIILEKGTDRKKFFSGMVDKYSWVDIGSSFLPSDLIAAFLYAQLENADRIVAKRLGIARAYHARLLALAQAGHIVLPAIERVSAGNGHIFYVLVRNEEVRRALIPHLNARGIEAVFHYVPLHTSAAGQAYGRQSGDLAMTESIALRLLRLPIYFEMSEDDVDYVGAAMEEFFR